MAYIGKTPVIGNFQKCDSISVVNGQAAYTLQVGGVNVSPQSENHMLVSLNGILQAPVDSFTVSGSTLTFASNLVTGDVIDFVMILGNVLDLGVPSDNTVTTAKLADSSVTTAKLNDSSVSLAKLTATGTKDATTFLRGDNTFAAAGGGKVLQVVSATDSTARSTSSTSFTAAGNTLSVNITPSSTSSKILIMCSTSIRTSSRSFTYTIFRGGSGGTNLAIGAGSQGFYSGERDAESLNIITIDSPSTTSSTNYQLFTKEVTSIGDGTTVINEGRSGDGDVMGTILAIEIDGS